MVSIAVTTYFINSYLASQEDIEEQREHDYLILRIDNLSAEREAENLRQTQIILDNMTVEIRKTRDDAHTNRLILEEIIEHQNITVQIPIINESTSGKISSYGIGKPTIIPSQ